MNPRVLRFPVNEHGRDFVVGDLHGAYDLVVEAMRLVKFDPRFDRLFGGGDLIDRGEDSWRVARFLGRPYVSSVRGNHDQNLLGLYEGGAPDPKVLQMIANRFGMEWWLRTRPDEKHEILAALQRLPIAIEIQTRRGLVGIVHGDVPSGMTWQAFLLSVEQGIPRVIDTALEGRGRIARNDQTGVPGVGRLFVGHTPQRGGPKRFGNVYAIDTGAIFNVLMGKDHYGLTMANVAAASLPLVYVGEGKISQVIVVDHEVRDQPFGDYVKAGG